MLLKIISNIRFVARKGPAIRGDSLEMGREANSYFTRLMDLRGEDDPRLLDWKTRKSNKYTSAQIQNEILKIIALKVLRDISNQIRKATFLCILADETTDSSNKEQVVVCIR